MFDSSEWTGTGSCWKLWPSNTLRSHRGCLSQTLSQPAVTRIKRTLRAIPAIESVLSTWCESALLLLQVSRTVRPASPDPSQARFSTAGVGQICGTLLQFPHTDGAPDATDGCWAYGRSQDLLAAGGGWTGAGMCNPRQLVLRLIIKSIFIITPLQLDLLCVCTKLLFKAYFHQSLACSGPF